MPRADPDKQRAFAVEVVEKLRAAGFDAYWAGGCVRDELLGLVPVDYDVATSAEPEQVKALFGRRTFAVGAAFGVITVLGPKLAGQIEVATFRRDAAYSDGRHPDSVSYSTAEEDAGRRDFTINGLFYDPTEHRVIDFVEGRQDLDAGLIRAIGSPQKRFAEDKLRLMRAVRFAARFGFDIEPDTWAAIQEMAPQLPVVGAERIGVEIQAMLVDPSRAKAMDMLRQSGLLRCVLPDDIPLPEPGAWQRTLQLLDSLQEPGFALALACLLYEMDGQGGADLVGRKWRLSNSLTQRAGWLLEHRDAIRGARRLRWPVVQQVLIQDGISDLLAMAEARLAAGHGDADDLEFCRERLAWPPGDLNPHPLINGDDLLRHGIPPGRSYKLILDRVRDAQLEKTVQTKNEALAMADRLLAEEPGRP